MEIRPIPHPLTGLFEGIQRGISLGLTMNKLRQEQQEREELLNLQKQKAQAEQEYQERQNKFKQLEIGLKTISDKYIPKAVKLKIYNETVVPLANNLGFQMTNIDDWPDEIDGYIKRALEIYRNKDYTWQQKKDFLTELAVETRNDPSLKPMFDNIDKKLEQEEQLAEQKAYRLYNKFLNNEITPDEADELEKILDQNYNAYKKGVEAATNNKRNELLMQKTQEEIKNLGTKHKLYHNKAGHTKLVNILNPKEVEEAEKQGYQPYAEGLLKSQGGESESDKDKKLRVLHAEYKMAVDDLNLRYGLKGGGLISKTLLDIDGDTRREYINKLDEINARYNEEYKRLTGRDAPFLVSPKTTNAGKQSSGARPSLKEIFGGE